MHQPANLQKQVLSSYPGSPVGPNLAADDGFRAISGGTEKPVRSLAPIPYIVSRGGREGIGLYPRALTASPESVS